MNDPLVITIVLVLSLLLVGVVVVFVRSPFTPAQTVLYGINYAMTHVWWRARVTNALPIKKGQGAVIVCNHRSSADPFFVQIATRRVIHWMVAKEYCEHSIFGWFLRTVESIPVNRGGIDTASTKLSIRLTSQGGIVGMFPEGRINMTDDFMLAGRPGAALIAIRSSVPIIPCFIDGAPYGGTAWSPFFKRARVRVTFGAPIEVPEHTDREPGDGVVARVMLDCLKELAMLAGQDDFEPSLAGRRWKPDEEELKSAIRERFG